MNDIVAGAAHSASESSLGGLEIWRKMGGAQAKIPPSPAAVWTGGGFGYHPLPGSVSSVSE